MIQNGRPALTDVLINLGVTSLDESFAFAFVCFKCFDLQLVPPLIRPRRGARVMGYYNTSLESHQGWFRLVVNTNSYPAR